MIKPEQIPDEVVTIAWDAFDGTESMREAIAAAINAWPGRSVITGVSAADAFGNHHPVHPMTLHLPLPQEKDND